MDVDERAFAEPDDEGRKLDTEDKRRPKMANDQNFYRWLQYCRSIPEAKDSPEAVQYMMAQFLHKKEASGLDPWKEFDRVYSRKEGVEPVYPENKPPGQVKRKNDDAHTQSQPLEEAKERGIFMK